MEKLNIEEIIKRIEAEQPLHAVASDYSFTIKIEKYVPYVCGAIHDGHQFRKKLWGNCIHSEYDRWYEEDPETKNMVIGNPIVIAGCDSRFEYDLNRPLVEAVFETAWGKQLWKTPLSSSEKEHSLRKHQNFYKVAHALIHKIESKFGVAIVYDMHSYNWRRWDREVPTWNLGTTNLDEDRFGKDIETWRQSLSEIEFPNDIKSDAAINNTFYGNGYFLKYITKNFENTLVLATEIAKVYCQEYDQVIYPEVVAAVKEQLSGRIVAHANSFINRHAK